MLLEEAAAEDHLVLGRARGFLGGAPGAIHIFVLTSHDPTIASIALCGAPGVAYAIQAFIISSWLTALAAAGFAAGAA